MRRVLAAGMALSVLPSAVVLLAARPVSAAPAGYARAATTALVAGVRTEGVVGASGGLATLDTGSGQVRAALDDQPSAYVLAAPYEPGGLVRTLVGQVNTGAGEQVLDVPDAEATYPGTPHASSIETVPGTSAGPVAVLGGSASAQAGAHEVSGTATGSSLAVTGALVAGASTSAVRITVDAAAARVTVTARSSVASVDVAGVLHLSDVVAAANVTASGDTHTAVQSLTVGGADVNGQGVTIGNDGVTAAGSVLLPGQTLEQATEQANAVLAAAGISVRTVGGRAVHDSRSAAADTGGVLITLTQDVAGLGANTLTTVVGGASLTENDELPMLDVVDPCQPFVDCSQGGVVTGPPPVTTTTVVPGTPGTPEISGTTTPPTVAGPQAPVAYVLAGRRFSAQTALVAFAAWQLFSLGMPTLYALVERRRRLQLAGRAL